MSEFRGEMKTLVQTYVELLYPDDLEMQDALFENITTGKASVTLEEMRDYVATRSSWYAEIEAVNPAMAVVHNQNDEFVGTVEVMDMDDDPDGVEVFINDEQMNEISSINLYEDDRFWEDYDAETFNATRVPYTCTTYTCRTEIGGTHKGSDAMRFLAFLNEIKHTVGISNIQYQEEGEAPFGTVTFKFDICGYAKSNITYLKAYLDGLRDGMIRRGADYEDLHRPIQTLAEGDEPNEEWYMEAETFNAQSRLGSYYRKSPLDGGTRWAIDWEGDSRYKEYYLTLENNPNDIEILVLYDPKDSSPYTLVIPQPDTKLSFASMKEVLEYLNSGNTYLYPFTRSSKYHRTRYRTSTPHKRAETFNAMSFKQWSQDEMNEELHGGQDMDFDSWLKDEIHTHGNIPLREWGYEEEHDEPEHQHAESMMSEDYMTDEEILRAARNDIDNQISRGTFYTLGQEPQAFHDGEIDGENFYTIISLYCQYAEDEDRCEKKLQDMFKKDYAEYMGDESFYAESMMSKRGKVRTLSGKPHKARKMKKDKMISPEEAKTRLSFRARKGIDTYAEPFEEIGSFYSGKKGILKIVGLGALVSAGVWITKNKLLE